MEKVISNYKFATDYLNHIMDSADRFNEEQQYFLRNSDFIENFDSFIDMDDYFFDIRDAYGRQFANNIQFYVEEEYAQLNDDETILNTLSDKSLLGLGKMLSQITGVAVDVCIPAIRTGLWTNTQSISFTQLGYAGLDAEFIDYEEAHEDAAQDFFDEYRNIFNKLFKYCGNCISEEFEELNHECASDLMSYPLFIEYMAQNDSWKFPL